MGFAIVAALNGIAGLAFGAVALFAPAALASIYGIDITDRESVAVRMLGAAYIGLGVLAWAARAMTDAGGRAAVALGQLAGWALTLAVVLPAQLAGYGNALAWSIPVMQTAFVLAWASVLMAVRRERRVVLA